MIAPAFVPFDIEINSVNGIKKSILFSAPSSEFSPIITSKYTKQKTS